MSLTHYEEMKILPDFYFPSNIVRGSLFSQHVHRGHQYKVRPDFSHLPKVFDHGFRRNEIGFVNRSTRQSDVGRHTKNC